MLTLDLAMITYRPDGIERLAKAMLPQVPGVRYVISWQDHRGAKIPQELLSRSDIEILRFDRLGQSLNRNNAIAHCRADIILHADDDVIYTVEGFNAVIQAFESHPEMDVATFRSIHDSWREFPNEVTNLATAWPRNYYVATFEIAFRRSSAGHLRCCPELGLASPKMHGGEDEMFLFSAIRRGLTCYFIPATICEHPGVSTGEKSHFSNENLRACGCVIALSRPATAILRVPLKAWRVSRAGKSGLIRALRYISLGALAAPGVLRRNHDTLW